MINPITRFLEQRLNEKQRQWAWFVILWCGGFLSVTLLGSFIKLIMRL